MRHLSRTPLTALATAAVLVAVITATVGMYFLIRQNLSWLSTRADQVQSQMLGNYVEQMAERATAEEGTDAPIPPGNEVAMSPETKIVATTPNGTMQIAAGKGLKRSFTWEGATRTVEMWPRGERWLGSLGLAFPGPGDHWQNHNGITRGVIEEGQQHFKTTNDALQWIRQYQQYMPFVYRNDGLMVGWDKTLPRRQLNVNVWQIMIDGKKPTSLPGSEDDKIVVEDAKPP